MFQSELSRRILNRPREVATVTNRCCQQRCILGSVFSRPFLVVVSARKSGSVFDAWSTSFRTVCMILHDRSGLIRARHGSGRTTSTCQTDSVPCPAGRGLRLRLQWVPCMARIAGLALFFTSMAQFACT